jgi:hypothetical protein
VFPLTDAGSSPGGPLLWIVCGAGRGVGKTQVALALSRILPGAVYAKQGTSPRRPGKAESYFRTDKEMDAFLEQAEGADHCHLVVESNALARRGRGDIIIFLEDEVSAGGHGLPDDAAGGHGFLSGARPDADLLRSLAHVVLDRRGPGPDPETWKLALARKGLEPAMMGPVIEVLAAQAAWNRRTRA